MERHYFFFDIDETLAVGIPGEQYVPESALYALRQLEARGHFIAIATGRSYMRAIDYMQSMGFHNMVSDGGYALVIDDELLYCHPLDHDACIAFLEECIAKNMTWAVTTDLSGIRYTPDDRFLTYSLNFPYMQGVLKEDLDIYQEESIYKIYVACPTGQEKTLETLKNLPYGRFNDRYIYIQPDDKAGGIRAVVDHLGGRYQDVVVFGDHVNDLSMFCDEWTNIAVGNAVDALKAKATYVTSDAADDGIYRACVHFGWIDDDFYQ